MPTKIVSKLYYVLVASLMFSTLCSNLGCSPAFKSNTLEASDESKLESPDEGSDFHPPPDEDVELPVILSPGPDFCSELDLENVTWPMELGMNGRNHLGLALNITGSFEGRSGWANLSSNFDGMGFSIGLLQQNLGTGSLQPMLMEMINMTNRGESFQMESVHTQSLQTMLAQWNKDKASKQAVVSSSGSLFHNDDSVISQYDSNSDLGVAVPQDPTGNNEIGPMLEIKTVASANKNAVSWALRNIYSDGGSNFKSDWKTSLTRMAQSKPYIGLQLKYAMKIYSQAFQYFSAFKLTTVSHFLLMFDFVVQNGGFKQRLFEEYNAKLKAKPNMSAQDKALLILDLRIRDVLPRWQSDVISRKKAIIFSEGTVHGAKRNLKQEYCYTPDTTVLTQP